MFWYNRIKYDLLKRIIPRSLNLVGYSLDSMAISWNISRHFQFSFHFQELRVEVVCLLWPSIDCCGEAHWSMWTNQRQNVWLLAHTNETNSENNCASRNYHRNKTAQPNSMILVSCFSGECALSDEVKTLHTFGVAENWKSAIMILLFGTPNIYSSKSIRDQNFKIY